MSGKVIAEAGLQPATFAWTPESESRIAEILAKYPPGRQASAVLPLLDLAHRQNDNWIPQEAIEVIAERVGLARIRVLEVATFYPMFNLAPAGMVFLTACNPTTFLLS